MHNRIANGMHQKTHVVSVDDTVNIGNPHLLTLGGVIITKSTGYRKHNFNTYEQTLQLSTFNVYEQNLQQSQQLIRKKMSQFD